MNNLAVIRHVVTWFDASETRVRPPVLSHPIARRNCSSNVIERPRRLPTEFRGSGVPPLFVRTNVPASLPFVSLSFTSISLSAALTSAASSLSRLSGHGRITFTPLWPCRNFIASLCDSRRLSVVLLLLGQRVLTADRSCACWKSLRGRGFAIRKKRDRFWGKCRGWRVKARLSVTKRFVRRSSHSSL